MTLRLQGANTLQLHRSLQADLTLQVHTHQVGLLVFTGRQHAHSVHLICISLTSELRPTVVDTKLR